MKPLRFAMFGAGFWSPFQLAGWGEIEGAHCVAIYNRTREKAEQLAKRFHVDRVYDDARQLFDREQIDFVDIVTDAGTHRQFVFMAAARRIPAICQKPLANSLQDAREMEAACRDVGVPLLVHENWRWQAPLRALKEVLGSGRIGKVFRGRIQYSNSFPAFENQPFLKELDRFILTDIGTHILDVVRFLFGEAVLLYCQTYQVHSDIRGEDVATVMIQTNDRATVTCEMSYASRVEHDRFPETYVFVEGEQGSAELGPDFWLRVTTAEGTLARRVPPPRYAWADPAYHLVHASIVPCHADLIAALRGEKFAETTAADNLRTLELVHAAYESAESGNSRVLAPRGDVPGNHNCHPEADLEP
jgi:predicted dehydrogenase